MTTPATTDSPSKLLAAHREPVVLALCVVGAGLAVASGAIHVYLWNHFYRHNAYAQMHHMDKLFLAQWILCFIGAGALLIMRNVLAATAMTALLAGTFIGFLIAKYRSSGLFGFALGDDFSSWEATWSMVVEIAGTVILFATAALMARKRNAV